ncbi:MAG: WG repeat-containing protein [Christensenellaceae bacterium]
MKKIIILWGMVCVLFLCACTVQPEYQASATPSTNAIKEEATAQPSEEKTPEPVPELVSEADMLPFIDADGKFGYMDKEGNILIQPVYDYAGRFSEGVAEIRMNDKSGYIDKTGNIVIEAKYDTGLPKNDGIVTVYEIIEPNTETHTVYLDEEGKELLRVECFFSGAYSQGMIRVKDTETSTMRFIDLTGKDVFDKEFTSVGDYFEGKAWFYEGATGGYIDKKGNVLFEGFTRAGDFSEGLAPVRKDGMWGYINEKGEFALKFPDLKEPDLLRPFENGKAFFIVNNLMGVIDKEGNVLVEPKFEGVTYIYDDLIGVYAPTGRIFHYETFDGEVIAPKNT